MVVEAFEAMRAAAPATKLIMVGDGPERKELQNRHPRVIFAGTRTGDELAAHFASADVFLFPSMTETFGNVTLEAMTSGLAVIAFDYAAAQQYVGHEVSGLLAPFGDAAAFTRLAAALATDPERIATLRAQARTVAERIDWEQVFSDFENVLVGVMRRQESVHA